MLEQSKPSKRTFRKGANAKHHQGRYKGGIKLEEERIKSYIIGFDQDLGGGIPKGHVSLLSGTPGTMKSTIGYSMLYHNCVKNNLKCLYLTVEQSGESLAVQMRKLGFDPSNLPKDTFHIVDMGLERESSKYQIIEDVSIPWFERLQRVMSVIQRYKPDLMVLDSLSGLYAMATSENLRNEIYRFFAALRNIKLTSFLISEMSPDKSIYSEFGIEDFLCDGIIHVKMERVDDVNIQRRIRCVKMRGANHRPHFYSLMFSNGEFQVTKVLSEV